eukprot:526646_1
MTQTKKQAKKERVETRKKATRIVLKQKKENETCEQNFTIKKGMSLSNQKETFNPNFAVKKDSGKRKQESKNENETSNQNEISIFAVKKERKQERKKENE